MIKICDQCNNEINFHINGLCLDCNGGMVVSDESKNKYLRSITWSVKQDETGIWIDVYDVLKAFNVSDQAVGHALKKLLAPGQRGHKGKLKDLREARDSITRAIDMEVNPE